MATKSKTTEAKTTTRTARKSPKKQGPAVSIPNADNRFEPGSTVAVYPADAVQLEVHEGRQPVRSPEKTVKVKADGTLEVSGLSKGRYTALADVDGEQRAISFSVGLTRKKD